ncbi:MAG: hypothetical protein WBQ17_13880 [Rhizomicrobium sp.]|jgi:hypothetical protein
MITIGLSTALALAPLSALAADTQPAAQPSSQATLAPGPAAGVQQAQGFVLGTTGWVVLGVVAAATIIAIAASNNGGGHSAPSTTGAP